MVGSLLAVVSRGSGRRQERLDGCHICSVADNPVRLSGRVMNADPSLKQMSCEQVAESGEPTVDVGK
jgi:hypothetical protein